MLAALSNVNRAFQAPAIFNTEQEVMNSDFPLHDTRSCLSLNQFPVPQRFNQHFDLLQKARLPEGVSYQLYKESIAHADISVRSACLRLVHALETLQWDIISFSHDPGR